ncbi:hypothetical protein EVAR_18473_1 [Eumeta japonica]|uniref:Uncharacterized protein n=1 Tax=Eumeta variegata TaxID=151549 RepID=A0A4C1V1I4_EUMVA|nr:hypothetical protein EVAR_18473_1 [Eumeta japonica]
MTIKNKKTNQAKGSQVSLASTSEKKVSSSSQQSTSSTSVRQSTSSSSQRVTSSGKKVRYIDVKVEEDDPLMITDVTDNVSVGGSTISEHYNSHPHYIITEAPSIPDLSQIRSKEHQVSDMSMDNTGEFVSSSMLQQSSTSHHESSSKNETFQTSSSSIQQSGSSHSQVVDTSSTQNQTMNTAFIDTSTNSANQALNTTFTSHPRGADATNTLLQSEREDFANTSHSSHSIRSRHAKNEVAGKITDLRTSSSYQSGKNSRGNTPEMSKRNQTLKTDSNKFFGGEGTLDKNSNTKQFTSTSQTSESKSSNVTKSSSSSYVVEIVDGKERIIDSSKREWGDSQEHGSKEAYASVSGTDVKPQSAYSIQNYGVQSKYDTGKDGKPSSELTVKEDSKFIKDGTEVTSHSSYISDKNAPMPQQIDSAPATSTTKQYKTDVSNKQLKDTVDSTKVTSEMLKGNKYTSKSDSSELYEKTVQDQSRRLNETFDLTETQHSNLTSRTSQDRKQVSSKIQSHDSYVQDTQNQSKNLDETFYISDTQEIDRSSKTSQDRRKITNTTDSSDFTRDKNVENQLRRVNEMFQVDDADITSFSTKIMKSNTSSAQQASASSYVFEVVDGEQRVVDSSHREWGDSKDRSSYEKSHNISGPGRKPEHEYSRHVLDKESHYDTGKDGKPTSSTRITEESLLTKDGQEIASTNTKYFGDFTKKPAITERPDTPDHHGYKHSPGQYPTGTHPSGPGDKYPDDKDRRHPTDQYPSGKYPTDKDGKHPDGKHPVDKDGKHPTDKFPGDKRPDGKHPKDVGVTSDFITTEKDTLTKETSSTTKDTQVTSKDTRTTYETSTGTWNGKFVYEKDDDVRNKRPKQVTPYGAPEQPRRHLQRQDTEDTIILSSRDIKDFTSISDLRKIIESTQSRKDVKVSDTSIVINRNIDDSVLKEIIDTVKKYPFKKIDRVTFGTRVKEDVKDLYEGIDTEEITKINRATHDVTKKSYEVEKTRSQIEVVRYITENGITRRIVTYEEPKEDEKVKTDVFVDKSDATDIRDWIDDSHKSALPLQQTDVRTTRDVVDRAITDRTTEEVTTVYDETTIIDDRKTVRDDTTVRKTTLVEEIGPRDGGPKKPEKIIPKEQCICEICTCG